MAIEHQHVTAHPGWCDPRCCADDGLYRDHRDPPMTWNVDGEGGAVAVGMVRHDYLNVAAPPGRTLVRLEVAEFDSRMNADMSPADARMLAAALLWAAERAERDTARRWSR